MTNISLSINNNIIGQLFNLSLKASETVNRIYRFKQPNVSNNEQATFHLILAKYDEIQSDYQNLKNLWFEAFGSNKKIKNLDAAIRAIEGFEQFLVANWNYFSEEDRKTIQKVAQKIPNPSDTQSWLSKITPKTIYSTLKLMIEYRNEFKKPLSENRIIILGEKSYNIAKLVKHLVEQEKMVSNQSVEEIQVKNNQAAIQHFKNRIEEIDSRTEEESKELEEFSKIFFEILENHKL